MSDANVWIDRQVRRLRFGRFLQTFGEWMAGFLLVFGAAVLLSKLAVPAVWPHVLWFACGVPLVAAAAWLVAARECASRAEAVALLDSRLGTGGLLMTLTEVPDEAWTDRLPADDHRWRSGLPRWRPSRFLRLMALPLVFAVGSCFVPLREAEAEPVVVTSTGTRAVEQLENVVTELDELQVLDEEERERVEKEIEKVREDAERGPLAREKWEAIDALRERLQLRLADATLDVDRARRAAAALARAAAQDGPPISPERSEELMEDVVETLRKMQKRADAGEGDAFRDAPPGVKDALERLVKRDRLELPEDPAERQKLMQDLEEFLDQEFDRLAECRGRCQGGMCLPGEKDGEGNRFSRREGEGNGRPGRGGITQGPGDANLDFSGETDEQAAKFKETVLPPGFLEDPANQVVGIKRRAPMVDPTGPAPRGSEVDVEVATGSETPVRPLRPRHRGVVKRYFGTDEE